MQTGMLLKSLIRAPKTTIKNPWVKTPQRPPYILEQDKKAVAKYNRHIKKNSNRTFLIRPKLLPEPFIGNPHTAVVIFLGLNPCYKRSDSLTHTDQKFRLAVQRNLRHKKSRYPFYPLNPRFRNSGVATWWRKCLSELLEEIQDDALVAKKVCAIEWFPYHSKRARLRGFRKNPLPSQEYSFSLLREALRDKTKTVVLMRADTEWREQVASLRGVLRLKNPQRSYVSRGNIGTKQFRRLLRAISA